MIPIGSEEGVGPSYLAYLAASSFTALPKTASTCHGRMS